MAEETTPVVEQIETTTDPTPTDADESAASEQTETTPDDSASPEDSEEAPFADGGDSKGGDNHEENETDVTYQIAIGNQVRSFSDREQVEKYLALGVQAEANEPTLERLSQLAHMVGADSAEEFLERSLEALDKRELDKAIAQYGQKEGEEYHAFQKAKRDKAYQDKKQSRAATDRTVKQINSERLARDFVELQSEYPDVADINGVPEEAVKLAIEKGIHLLDAYNRVAIKQQRSAAAVSAKASENQQSAVGSMADRAGGGSDPLIEAMKTGVGNL